MSQTDVSGVADAVSGIQIDGPGTPPRTAPLPTEIPLDEVEGETTVTISTEGATTGPIPLRALEDAAKGAEALFDSGAYLDVPTMDGQASDSLVLAFGGQIKYDATDDVGRDLFDAMTLGKPITLQVEGFVATKQGAYKENSEGEAVVTGKAGIKVTTIYVKRPEDLT